MKQLVLKCADMIEDAIRKEVQRMALAAAEAGQG